MNLVISTLSGPLGHATRLNLTEVVKTHPAVVDQWLLYPNTDCRHRHQLVLVAYSLADVDGVPPVPEVLRRYSHQVELLRLEERAAGGMWSPEQVLGGKVAARSLLAHPVTLDDDEQARRVLHRLVPDVTVGALPAFPYTDAEVTQWRLAITVAVYGRSNLSAGWY